MQIGNKFGVRMIIAVTNEDNLNGIDVDVSAA